MGSFRFGVIIMQFFFENEVDNTPTLNGGKHHNMLVSYFFTLIKIALNTLSNLSDKSIVVKITTLFIYLIGRQLYGKNVVVPGNAIDFKQKTCALRRMLGFRLKIEIFLHGGETNKHIINLKNIPLTITLNRIPNIIILDYD